VLRAFDDTEIIHDEGTIDPIRDIQIISEELLLKDIELVQTHMESMEKIVQLGIDKTKKAEYETAQKIFEWLQSKKAIRHGDWKTHEIEILNRLQLLTAKPVVYLVNLSENDYVKKKNKWLGKIKQYVDENFPGEVIIPFSCTLESKIIDMGEEEAKKYCTDNSTTSALPKIIKLGYHALDLVHFFTGGEDEVRAWTIRRYTKAPQAAGVIHTDFEQGFICAEVMKFEDFKELGSENAVKAGGKYMQQGKNYVVNDGDIIFFKFNVAHPSSSGKKK